MIETKVPKDIRVYKTKIFGPLTLKQFLLLVIAVVFDFVVYNMILKPMRVPTDVIAYIFILLDTPILALSMEPNGIPMEKFLLLIIRYNYLAPQKRKAKNRIKKEKIQTITAKEEKKTKKEIKKKLPEHPEYQAYH